MSHALPIWIMMASSRIWADGPIPRPDFDSWEELEPVRPRMVRSCSSQGGLPSLVLPDCTDPFQTITADELSSLLTDPMSHNFDRIFVLDARFSYEFRGGRISGARNVTTRAAMAGVYEQFKGQDVCIVFHCEFSRNRGPTLMRMFRDYDRRQNVRNYPELCFPNILLLEGGYRNFHAKFPELCTGGYVPMRDKKYVDNGELRRCYSDYSRDMLQEKEPEPGIRRRASQSSNLTIDLFGCSDGVGNSYLCEAGFGFSASQPL